MVMNTIQIRLTPEQIKLLDNIVSSGEYPSKSEAVRDAVRRFIDAKAKGEPDDLIETAQQELVEAIAEEAKNYQNVKGTVDFYPEEKAVKEAVFDTLRTAAQNFNFKEIETPAFETLELLTAKSGEELKTQIFTLEKRSTEQLGLRFDLTVPTARLFIQRQKELPKPVKWFYIDRMWRYEAPQKGRLREFYQYGVEVFGSDKPEADAEVIALAIESLESLGLTAKDIFVKVNNRKLLEGVLSQLIPKEALDDVIRLIDKSAKITEKEFVDELKLLDINEVNISKIQEITTLKGKPSEVLKKIDQTSEAIKAAVQEVENVLEHLQTYEDYLVLDLSVARGLAYYSGTVFEIFDREEKYRSLAGGGRYDELITLFNGEPTPATGFGMGYSTVLLVLEDKGLVPKPEMGPDYFVAVLGDVKKEAQELIKKLRENNVVETDIMQRNFGKQMRYANTIGAKKLIVLGENEIASGEVKIKDMVSGKEEVKKLKEIK